MTKDRVNLIIAGSRYFEDYDLLMETLDEFLTTHSVLEVVSGTCRGADKLGERWAKEHNIPVKQFPAQWDKYGKTAGPIRNREMANYGTHLVAFLTAQSRGTKNMIQEARRRGLEVLVIPIKVRT